MLKTWLKPARKLHKLLGYLLALQLFAWLLGGLVMSALPLEKVHGKHLAQRSIANPFILKDYPAWQQLALATESVITQLHFTHFLDTPLLKVERSEQPALYFSGNTGQPFSPPTQQQIQIQAERHYLGSGQVSNITLLDVAPREAGFRKNVWQVNFNDSLSTSLYLDAQSGQVITVRSTLWRIFDFFWMLHIMDYDEREDFNHPLLIFFAACSVLFCLSGMVLLCQSPPWRRKSSLRS
ncbi:hypothetical protein ACFOEE_14190 [Pseudoalteromonas fenneropenaei]|uniref:PepSY domain-containing protein n=1 Tax=Pseudoalteromonas fenneropenaei TaxID=1737459 RepID=A0ABV7CMJ6_9GAMM